MVIKMNILITGARSNIGYNIAKLLAKRGHIVYAGCKTKEEVKSLYEKINSEKIIMFPIELDLVKDNSKLIESLNLDCLVLQASIGNGGSILEISRERFNEVLDVNIKGNFRLIQDYLRYCYYHKRSGKIFLTSSLAAFLPLPYLSTYTASKSYLVNLANTLRLELLYQKLDVSISLILPGAYYTGFNDLMIENKELDNYLIKSKALKMTKYQKIFFSLIEKYDYSDLVKDVVKNIEKNKPSYIISRPMIEKLFTKLYVIIKSIIV